MSNHEEDDYIEGFSEKEMIESELNLLGPDGPEDILLEPLSDLMHQIWTHWMKYLYSKLEEDDLGMVINWPDYRHWSEQMATNYADLTESEKYSDREQARKIIAMLRVHNA